MLKVIIKKDSYKMFRKLKMTALAIAAAAVALVVPVAFTTSAMAATPDISGSLCSGANLTASGGTCSDSSGSNFNNILATIINIFSLIVGTVAVIMIIYAGFSYITSNGDSGKVSTAKNTILYAVIGLVIVAFAQAIVKFVLVKAKPV